MPPASSLTRAKPCCCSRLAAIDERLFLFETLAYTTEPDAMLEMLTRVVADRALGQVFFSDHYRMDVELVAGAVEGALRE